GPSQFEIDLDAANSIIFNKYKRPYSVMLNAGFQYEVRPGLVLSVDYLRNRGLHFNQTTDLNRLGAANTLNVGTARAAITSTANNFLTSEDDGPGPCVGMTGPGAIDCIIQNGGSILDFTHNDDFNLGAGSARDGLAFQGVNPNFRGMGFIQSLGV